MANTENEHSESGAASETDADSHQLRTPEPRSQSEMSAEGERAAAQSSAEELSESTAPRSLSLDGSGPAGETRLEVPEPVPSAPEPQGTAPGVASQQPVPPTRADMKSRSLLPSLAVTALTGASLGVGATLALLYLAGPQINHVFYDDRIAALAGRIDALEGKVDASAADRTALSAMETRVAAVESAANNAVEVANSAKADAQKAGEPASAGQGPASGSAQANAIDLGPIEARIAALEQKLASLEPALAAPKAALRAEPGQENAAAKHASRAQAIAVVSGSLLRRLDSGGPFSSELAALESLGVSQASLAPLRAVPGLTIINERQLAAQFSSIAPKIIASESASQTNASEGFLEHVERDLKGLVHIRRAGDAETGDVEGLVVRIENALVDNDLEAAFKVWQELPSAAKSTSETWGEAAKARLDALQAARSIEADAVAALGKPKT
jgi:hypothetical protein